MIKNGNIELFNLIWYQFFKKNLNNLEVFHLISYQFFKKNLNNLDWQFRALSFLRYSVF